MVKKFGLKNYDIAALCASVSGTQQRIQELFEGENPLEKLLPG